MEKKDFVIIVWNGMMFPTFVIELRNKLFQKSDFGNNIVYGLEKFKFTAINSICNYKINRC